MKEFKVVYYRHNSSLKCYVVVSAKDKEQAIENCFSNCLVSGNREDLIEVIEVE